MEIGSSAISTSAGPAEARVDYAQRLAGAGAEPVLTEVGSGEPCAVEVTVGAGRAVVVAAGMPCDLGFWRAALERLGARPRLAPDADSPGLVLTSTVDRAGQRLLHLVNVAPSAVTVGLGWHGRPVLGGRRLRVPARTGLILPYGVTVGAATLVETTCELISRGGDWALLRPTQGDDVVVLATDRPVAADRGTVEAAAGRVPLAVAVAQSAGGPLASPRGRLVGLGGRVLVGRGAAVGSGHRPDVSPRTRDGVPGDRLRGLPVLLPPSGVPAADRRGT
ncbi:hypothetical protein ACFY2R_05810 [Micromonospora olivasterospora]|uniref:Uncharacterized protein n=1 Tax=Micromonospora olivasterospora TaxID=1880 RepID=A0A562IIQ4_MICOL|nr:hypothetical protein [Micromonospora olivasterospora]TWH70514.1 hypothetical protein JD77_05539 [Micromonospora olivasterospora]